MDYNIVKDGRVLGAICRKYGIQYNEEDKYVINKYDAPSLLEYKEKAYAFVNMYSGRGIKRLYIFDTGKSYKELVKLSNNTKNEDRDKESTVYENEKIKVILKDSKELFKEPVTMYENAFLRINLINPNYPFLHMNKQGAVVVPYDKDGNVYMLKKKRPGVGMFYELPRGFVENKEGFEVGALRELQEETGMESRSSDFLGFVQPDTGIVNNNVAIYKVLVDEREGFEHHDIADGETNKVIKCNMHTVMRAIAERKIVCGFTLSGVIKYIASIKK